MNLRTSKEKHIDTFIYVKDIAFTEDLNGFDADLAKDTIFKLKPKTVYRAQVVHEEEKKASDKGKNIFYISVGKNEEGIHCGVFLNEDDVKSGVDMTPIVDFSFEEVDVKKAAKIRMPTDEYLKLLEWIDNKNDKTLDPMLDDNYEDDDDFIEFTGNDNTMSRGNGRGEPTQAGDPEDRLRDFLKAGAKEVPMEWVKFQLYELRENSPESFINIIQLIEKLNKPYGKN